MFISLLFKHEKISILNMKKLFLRLVYPVLSVPVKLLFLRLVQTNTEKTLEQHTQTTHKPKERKYYFPLHSE